MTIKEIVAHIEDAYKLANSDKEKDKLIKNFINSFDEEYVILDVEEYENLILQRLK